jgi:integrase
MATIFKAKNNGKCSYGIKFKSPQTNTEQRIMLGKANKEQAQLFQRNINRIIRDMSMGTEFGQETCLWLNQLPAAMHKKLVKHGLCKARSGSLLIPTLSQWIVKYLASKQQELKRSSLERIQATCHYLLGFFSNGKLSKKLDQIVGITLDKITEDHANSWRLWLLKQELSQATVHLHIRNAKALFKRAVDQKWIVENPWQKLKSSAIAAERTTYVTPEQAALIVQKCSDQHLKLSFALARWAGLRSPSETHSLSWSDIDWKQNVMTVLAPKTSKKRTVPIRLELRQLLQHEHRKLNQPLVGPVITNKPNNLHRKLQKLLTKLKIPVWADLFQTLRRSCETEWAETCPQHAVSSWIGHDMRVSQQHYLMTTPETLDKVRAPITKRKQCELSIEPILAVAELKEFTPRVLSATTRVTKPTQPNSEVEKTIPKTIPAKPGNGQKWLTLRSRSAQQKTPSILRNEPQNTGFNEVARAGVEPATHGFSVRCSTN